MIDDSVLINISKEDLDHLLCEEDAYIGAILKLYLDGYKLNAINSEDTLKLLEDFADSLIEKSPEAALEFKKEFEQTLKKERL